VLTGDYNFDVNINTKKGNPAFVAMTDEGVFRWLEPTPFRATHKAGSVLDFVFLSGPAQKWSGLTEVVKLSDDAVDTLSGSDHRPVKTRLSTTGAPAPFAAAEKAPAATAEIADAQRRLEKRNELLRRIGDLDRELAIIRRLVRELGDD
jgi:hypothetical protein